MTGAARGRRQAGAQGYKAPTFRARRPHNMEAGRRVPGELKGTGGSLALADETAMRDGTQRQTDKDSALRAEPRADDVGTSARCLRNPGQERQTLRPGPVEATSPRSLS